ncbi:MAG: hypothetical protein HOD43_00780 [Candidatus Marinimicrobia bacterium]|jgi:hypothetical protein|nr:hypothetical protein [Candidatus Neomarinimicrobiota bacterium]MBT3630725.1 hypothetical protein [Candidatus Neomarinimicrobiota bacterium]MBT3825620.1 hypothetical protein [Candidatus Neomarinimicrobiota bacterium]MBT4132622.1 hypothetical protein [Candidatus Neomarinimicrobiota bacterium]MBT4294321.1 hypothetical protein [Candidatus Neomarinimicrobiota bacterium]
MLGKNKIIIITLSTMLLISSLVAGEFKAEQPILITTAGQSADVLMVKVLAKKAGLDFTVDKLATSTSLGKAKSLIIVTGGSTKGLGAAKIDKDDEISRVQTLITAAKKQNIPIVTMHIGGKARRGSLSDEFNSVASQAGSCLVVVEGGNEDGYFTKVAETNKVPLIMIKKIIEVKSVLTNIFGPEKK